jgi:hypothetical protein
MDTNFASRYDAKIEEWETLINNDPSNSEKYTDEMTQYMLDCIPYIERYENPTLERKKEHSIIEGVTSRKCAPKKKIYQEYLERIEDINTDLKYEYIKNSYCSYCNSSNIYNDSTASHDICMDCGRMIYVLGMEMTYKDEHELSEKTINYSYKRSNHFQEWLNQLQATESTNIPPEVLDSLRSEFKKMKIKNLKEITHTKVRSLLKKLRMNRYYEHVPYISNILNGIPPMQMPALLQEKLKNMFNEIQIPFDKHCPSDRKNFLSYSYVLYKFCELLSEDEYLVYFPLLKSREKLYTQDIIWKRICKELKWEFIPTI